MEVNNLLYQTALEYKALSKNNYKLFLNDGTFICVRFPSWRYHHLAGLQYFKDISEVTINAKIGRTAISVYNSILHRDISIYDLQLSHFYDGEIVTNRLSALLRIESLFKEGTNVIPNYDKSVLSFETKIAADSVMYCLSLDTASIKSYMQLFLVKDKHGDYLIPISFFENDSDKYIAMQRYTTIEKVEITEYNPNNRTV